eukprot:GILI01023177.1.p1 GENE.GILI01023177.1~~GILI01023177.1.p1  ORF type:complete len:476 (+),score=75.01 GILI01023177.1:86-1513(+)
MHAEDAVEKVSESVEVDGALFLRLVMLVYAFSGIAVICDESFLPCLEQIRKRFRIPASVAGATLLAVGSSTPEISTNILATFNGDVSLLELGLGAIVGSGVFEYTVVLGVASLASRGHVALTPRILIRDIIFYSFSVGMLYAFVLDKQIVLHEALFLILLWVFYIWVVSVMKPPAATASDMKRDLLWNHGWARPRSFAEDDFQEEEDDDEISPALKKLAEEGTEKSFASFCFNSFLQITLAPWRFVSKYTIPIAAFQAAAEAKAAADVRERVPLVSQTGSSKEEDIERSGSNRHCFKQVPAPDPLVDISVFKLALSFSVCIMYISACSHVIVEVITSLVGVVGVSHALLGLTFIAWGSNVPDLFNISGAVRRGLGDMAISAAIGSQIVNILVGLGLPWLIALLSGRKIYIESTSAVNAVLMLGLMALVFLISVALNRMSLTKVGGAMLLACYFIFLFYEWYRSLSGGEDAVPTRS